MSRFIYLLSKVVIFLKRGYICHQIVHFFFQSFMLPDSLQRVIINSRAQMEYSLNPGEVVQAES